MGIYDVIEDFESKIRGVNNISLEAYLALRGPFKNILEHGRWELSQSPYYTDKAHQIKIFMEEQQQKLASAMSSEFNQLHRKFEEEYLYSDDATIQQRRERLDYLAGRYTLVIENFRGTRDDHGIIIYGENLKIRECIRKDFMQIKQTYLAVLEQEVGPDRLLVGNNIKVLKNLACRRLFSRSSLNLADIIAGYRRIEYQEGAIEAEKLQQEISNYARALLDWMQMNEKRAAETKTAKKSGKKTRQKPPEELEGQELLKNTLISHCKPDEDGLNNWYRDLKRFAYKFGYNTICCIMDILEPKPNRSSYTAPIAVERILESYSSSNRKKSPEGLLPLVQYFKEKHHTKDVFDLGRLIASYLSAHGTDMSWLKLDPKEW